MTGPAVIAFTVHNRPHYLRETLASWSRVRGIGEAELIFRCEPGCTEAARACVMNTGLAGSATVHVNPQRYGVLANPWHAMETAFTAGARFAILAEEDTPVADDVLEYFAWAAAEYETDERIAAVCAHHLGRPRPGGPADVFRDPLFSPIVWGTWICRWQYFFRPDWDFDYSHNGWDWHVNAKLAAGDLRVIKPVLSRSQHIGELGGAHCTPEFFPQTVAESFREHYGRQDYRETG